jgi:hypothetical protein
MGSLRSASWRSQWAAAGSAGNDPLGQPVPLKPPLPDGVGHTGVRLDVMRHDRFDLNAELGLDVATRHAGESSQLRIGYRF